jgi:hypothetical protein
MIERLRSHPPPGEREFYAGAYARKGRELE